MSIEIASAAAHGTMVPGRRLSSVLGLSWVEGRRLITHPAILVAPGLLLVTGLRGPRSVQFLFLSGLGYVAIGMGTFMAANLGASRSRRDRTEELLTSLPLRAADRTAAQLLSVFFPLTAVLVIATVLAMATRPWAGASARLDIEPRMIMHGLLDFAQAPLMIAFLGVAGVMLARWFSPPIGAPVALGGIIAIKALTGLAHGPWRWLNPVSTYSSTALEPASVMPWHLVYLAGLILLIGLVALARRSRAHGLQVYGAIAVALTAVGAVMQALAASP